MNRDEPTTSRVLADLAGELQQVDEEDQAAGVIVTRVVELVPDAEMASLTVRVARNRFVTLASSHEQAAELDQLQYTLGEGPCVDAATQHEWSRSGDVSRDRRWSQWGPRAAEHGATSLLSVRLDGRERPMGALNLYASASGAFSDRDEIDFALLYAAHCAIALTATRTASGLTTALHTRHSIGLAQGILMERYGISVDQSFALLRRYSSEGNVRLASLADRIVTSGQLPEGLHPGGHPGSGTAPGTTAQG